MNVLKCRMRIVNCGLCDVMWQCVLGGREHHTAVSASLPAWTARTHLWTVPHRCTHSPGGAGQHATSEGGWSSNIYITWRCCPFHDPWGGDPSVLFRYWQFTPFRLMYLLTPYFHVSDSLLFSSLPLLCPCCDGAQEKTGWMTRTVNHLVTRGNKALSSNMSPIYWAPKCGTLSSNFIGDSLWF